MESNILQILDTSFESFRNSDMTVDNLNDELTYYESLIPKFFSKTGEEQGIRKMYEGVEEKSERTLTCVDVTRSIPIYDEYLEGMTQYIKDIKESGFDEDANLETLQATFESVKDKDSLFIDSLFGGATNKQEEMSVKEAAENIECLIEFIPHIQSMKQLCESVTEGVDKEPDGVKKELLNKTISMMIESVANYSYSMVKTIFETYDNIMSTLDAEEIPAEPDFRLI